jgi:hypothetical protein
LHSEAYSFDGGATWQSGNTKTVSTNGTVQIKVRDKAENDSSTTATAKIDTLPPNTFTAYASASGNTVTVSGTTTDQRRFWYFILSISFK